jgi:transposase
VTQVVSPSCCSRFAYFLWANSSSSRWKRPFDFPILHLHRDLETLQRERTRTSNRIKGLLSPQGVQRASVNKRPAPLEALRLWDGSPVPRGLRQRLLRVYAHYTFLGQQMAEWAAERRASVRTVQEATIDTVRQLMPRTGIGINGAWVFVMACFGWRDLQNRRQVGSLAG